MWHTFSSLILALAFSGSFTVLLFYVMEYKWTRRIAVVVVGIFLFLLCTTAFLNDQSVQITNPFHMQKLHGNK
jgi:hypothetical protein